MICLTSDIDCYIEMFTFMCFPPALLCLSPPVRCWRCGAARWPSSSGQYQHWRVLWDHPSCTAAAAYLIETGWDRKITFIQSSTTLQSSWMQNAWVSESCASVLHPDISHLHSTLLCNGPTGCREEHYLIWVTAQASKINLLRDYRVKFHVDLGCLTQRISITSLVCPLWVLWNGVWQKRHSTN